MRITLIRLSFIHEREIGVFARYYLWKGLYGELGLGYHTHSGLEDITEGTRTYSYLVVTSGVAISPGLGWKFDPGKAGGFFVEPGVIVPITIGKQDFGFEQKPGVSTGFVLYCGLGFAF